MNTRRIFGANDRIGVGLIGCGKRGRDLAGYVGRVGGAEVRAVCDAYAPREDQVRRETDASVRSTRNHFELLECRDLDAVVIATPDHWHVPMVLDAVGAGKDVYVEKPITHSLEEGHKLLNAVSDSRSVVATGTQQRSWDHFVEARRIVQEGVLGRITLVRCFWYQNLSRLRPRGTTTDVSVLDWDRWLGPARPQAYDEAKFRCWRFFWDFGGGSASDLLTHWIDLIQWYMDSPKPKAVHTVGAQYTHDWVEAPDTLAATILYPQGFMVTFEASMDNELLGAGIVFRGDQAMMVLDRFGYSVYEEGLKPLEAVSLPRPVMSFKRDEGTSTAAIVDGNGTTNNVRNWLDCVRSRTTPNAHVHAGVEAAATAQWVNRALRSELGLAIP